MKIPDNISKEHLSRAIKRIKNDGIPAYASSQYYDVVLENGEKYPPKLILSYANLYANGEELDRTKFRGGLNTECFNLLQKYGFKIEPSDEQSIP